MAFISQLKLTLWKHVTIRKRQPVTLLLEFAWPVMIFLIAMSVRHMFPTEPVGDCIYRARAMPSAGLLPFMQSFVCNLGNDCENLSSYEEIPTYSKAKLGTLVNTFYPMIQRPDVQDVLTELPTSMALATHVVRSLDVPEGRQILADELRVSDLFKDVEVIREYLVDNHQMSSEAADSLFKASFDVGQLLKVLPHASISALVCDAVIMDRVLNFPDATNVTVVVASLCPIVLMPPPKLVQQLISQINVRGLINKAANLLRVLGSVDLSNLMDSVGGVINALQNIPILNSMASVPFNFNVSDMAQYMQNALEFLNVLKRSKLDLNFLGELMDDLERIVGHEEMLSHVKAVGKHIHRVIVWAQTGVLQDQEPRLVVEDLVRDPEATMLILKNRTDLTDETIRHFMKIRTRSGLTTGKDVCLKMCEQTAVDDIIEYDGNFETSDLLQLWSVMCNDQMCEELIKDNLTSIKPSAPQNSVGVTVASITADLQDLLKHASYLGGQTGSTLKKLFPILDLLWKASTTGLSIAFLPEWDIRNITFINGLASTLETLPVYLPEDMRLPMLNLITAADVALNIAVSVAEKATEVDFALYNNLVNNRQSLEKVLAIGPDAISSFAGVFAQEETINIFVERPMDIKSKFCNKTFAEQLVPNALSDDKDVAAVQQFLCTIHVEDLVKIFNSIENRVKLIQQVEKTILENDEGDIDTAFGMRFRSLCHQIWKTVHVVDTINTQAVTWQQFLLELDFPSQNIVDPTWRTVQAKLEGAKYQTILNVYTVLLGRSLDRKRYVGYAEKLMTQVGVAIDAISNEALAVPQDLLDGLAKYWPSVIRVFLNSLADPEMVNAVVTTREWSDVVCDSESLIAHLRIPVALNTTDFLQFLCRTTKFVESKVLKVDWYSKPFVKTIKELSEGEHLGEKIKIRWTPLLEKVRSVFDRYDNLVTRSLDHTVEAEELIGDAKRIFATMNTTHVIKFCVNVVSIVMEFVDRQLVTITPWGWKHVKAFIGIVDLLVQHVVKEMDKIIAENKIETPALTFGLKTLTKLGRQLIRLFEDYMNAAADVLSIRMGDFIGRIFAVVRRNATVCEDLSVTDVYTFKPRAGILVRDLEKLACTSWKTILSEIIQYPLMFKLVWKVREAMRDGDVVLDWNATSVNLWRLVDDSEILSTFNGQYFPDVEGFSVENADAAVERFVNAVNLNSTEKGIRFLMVAADAALPILENVLRTKDLDNVRNMTELFETPFRENFTAENRGELAWYALKAVLKTADIILDDVTHIFTNFKDTGSTVADLFSSSTKTVLGNVFQFFPDYVSTFLHSVLNPDLPNILKELEVDGQISLDDICSKKDILDRLIVTPTNLQDTTRPQILENVCKLMGSPEMYFLFEPYIYSWISQTIEKVIYIWREQAPHDFYVHLVDIVDNSEFLVHNAAGVIAESINVTRFFEEIVSEKKWQVVGDGFIQALSRSDNDSVPFDGNIWNNLRSWYHDRPQVLAIIDVLQNIPELTAAVVNTLLHPRELRNLIQKLLTLSDDGTTIVKFCIDLDLDSYFLKPVDVSFDGVQTLLCNTDWTHFVQSLNKPNESELQSATTIATITSDPLWILDDVRWRHVVNIVDEFLNKINANRSHLINVAIGYASLIDLLPAWSSPQKLLQLANVQLASGLQKLKVVRSSTTKRRLYDIITDVGLMHRAVNEIHLAVKEAGEVSFKHTFVKQLEFFDTYPNETSVFCQSSSSNVAPLDFEGVDITAVFNVLCTEETSNWLDILITSLNIPRKRLPALIESIMRYLPDESLWKTESKWKTQLPFDWLMLSSSVHILDDLCTDPPPEFYPEFQWSSWRPVFKTFGLVLPEILVLSAETVCPLMPPIDYTPFTEVVDLLDKQLSLDKEYQQLFCDLPLLNLTSIYRRLKSDMDLVETLRQARISFKRMSLETIVFEIPNNSSCPPLFNSTSVLSHTANALIVDLAENEQRQATLLVCYEHTKTAIMNVTVEYMKVFGRAMPLLNMPNMAALSNVTDLRPIVESLLNFLKSQVPVFVQLESIMRDNFTLGSDWMNENSLIDVLKGNIHLNRLAATDFREYRLVEIFCNATKLEKFFKTNTTQTQFGATDGMMDDVRDLLCPYGPNNNITISMTTSFLNSIDPNKVKAILPGLQVETMLSFKLVMSVGRRFKSLTQALMNMKSILGNNMDLEKLIENVTMRGILDILLPLTYARNMETMAKSLDVVALSMAPIVYGSLLEDDLNSLAQGTEGIYVYADKNLRNLTFVGSDLLADPDAVGDILLNAGAESTAVEFFLGTSFNASYIMFDRQVVQLEDVFCDVIVFEQALFMRRDRRAAVILYKTLCSPNKTVATLVIDAALLNLNLKGIITQVANLMVTDIAMKAGVEPSSAVRAIKAIFAARQLLPIMMETFDDLKKDSGLMGVLKQLNPAKLSKGEITAEVINIGGNMLCGHPIRTFVEYFKLLQNVGDRPPEARDRAERNSLPTQFCQDLYQQVAYRPAGLVIWGFVKPFLRGKILYAPENEATRRVIVETNRTFERMADGIEIIQIWANGFGSLGKFADEELVTMEELLSLPMAKSIVVGLLGDEVANVILNISGFLEEMGNPQRLLRAAGGLGEGLKCVETNRFVGFQLEEHMERAAMQLEKNNEFFGGIVFNNLSEDDDSDVVDESHRVISKRAPRAVINRTNSISGLPKHIRYRIRMDIDDVPTTKRLKEKFYKPDPEDNFVEHLRYLRGFVQLQEMVDRAIISLQTNANNEETSPGIFIQQFPHPCRWRDNIGLFLRSNVPATFALAFLFIVAFFVREIVLEREMMLEQVMRVMGLKSWTNWLCWLICCIVVILVATFGATLVLKYGGLYGHSNPLILFGYFYTYAFSVIMFCYLVSVFFSIATVAAITAVILYICSFIPFIVILTSEAHLGFIGRMLMSLFMSTSFSQGCMYISRFEEQEEGLQWSNLFKSPIPDDPMNLGWTFVMLIIDIAIYFVLATYFSALLKVISRTDKKKWRFLLFPFELSPMRNKKNLVPTGTVVNYSENGANGNDPVNKDGRKMRVGISLKNLRKVYNPGKSSEKTAVQSLSLDFYEGQITTLLGENGAGKTTTINMITGLFPPLSGSAKVYGRDVITEFDIVRRNMGLCPQYNVLFDLLTIREHLEFYGKLKGVLTSKKLKEDVDSLLIYMGLQHRQHELAKNMSGGMRRRLCVGIAFVGGSRTIILDEPTSGVDPVARRHIWDLIVKFKRSRTILLTTHHLDEADILSDRVAIIHKGKLLCCGTPLTLKRGFGSGYQLTLCKTHDGSDSDSGAGSTASTSSEMDNTCDAMTIYNFIQPIIPNVQLVEDKSSESTFCLPYTKEDGTLNSFDNFFLELEKHQSRLGIGRYGLSCTSLEEVFLNVCVLADAGLPINSHGHRILMLAKKAKVFKEEKRIREEKMAKGLAADPTITSVAKVLRRTESKVDADAWLSKSLYQVHYTHLSGSSLKRSQFKSLLVKRFHRTRRDWKAFVTCILLPCIFVAIAMGFTLIRPKVQNFSPSLFMSPAIYGPYTNSFIKINQEGSAEVKRLASFMMDPPGIGTACLQSNPPDEPYPKCIMTNKPSMHMTVKKNKCACESMESDDDDVCLRRNRTYELKISVTNTTDMIYNIIQGNVTFWLMDTHPEFIDWRFGGWTFGAQRHPPALPGKDENVVVWFNNKGHHAMPSYINSISNALLRSNIDPNQDDPYEYGISTYNHPLHLTKSQLGLEAMLHHVADVGISLIFLAAFSFIPAGFVVYIVKERIHQEKRLQYVSGVGPVLYWSAAYFYDTLMLLVPIALSAVIISIFNLPIYVYGQNFIATIVMLFLFGWATLPLMYILEKFFNEPSMASMVLFCINIFIGINTTVCTLILYIFQNNPGMETMLNILRYLFLVFPQYAFAGGLVDLAKNYIQAEIFERFGDDSFVDPFSFKLLGYNIIALICHACIFFTVTILLEYFPNVIDWFDNRSYKRPTNAPREDEDVRKERQRVFGVDSRFEILRLVDLTKVYGRGSKKNVAVDRMCLSIPKGECFGLLGVNGAGKTTTFQMLTGEIQPTYGEALYKNKSICDVISEGSQNIGYCPQDNALDDLLTAEEHLSVYAGLRGIPDEDIPLAVYKAVVQFNLQAHARNIISSYSCGTKRKLCAAIAVLGNPDIVLMDEPTSGMDPATRRLVWNNIHQIVKDKRSVILTSHSMEECDTLCNRLAIMVNGRFQCLGSPQSLKHKFSDGYTITLRIQQEPINMKNIVTFIQSTFPGSVLKAQHCNTVEFLVPGNHTSLGDIFSNLEKSREDLHIEDFSVTQTTLDQVFVNFVRQQVEMDNRATSSSSSAAESGRRGVTNMGFVLGDESANGSKGGSKLPDMYREVNDYEVTKF